jgi:sugar phosphate isomerase/epimerase
MTQDDIIRMAREAGMKLAWIATIPGSNKMKVLLDVDQVERFAELVAAAEREWVGLTDEEEERLIHNFGSDPHTLLDEVNARLQKRNT